jgi:hypothetical protein
MAAVAKAYQNLHGNVRSFQTVHQHSETRFYKFLFHNYRYSRGSLVSIVNRCGLNVRIPALDRDISLQQIVQTGSGVHAASYAVGFLSRG